MYDVNITAKYIFCKIFFSDFSVIIFVWNYDKELVFFFTVVLLFTFIEKNRIMIYQKYLFIQIGYRKIGTQCIMYTDWFKYSGQKVILRKRSIKIDIIIKLQPSSLYSKYNQSIKNIKFVKIIQFCYYYYFSKNYNYYSN